ncbi:MAG: hypothetical protein N3D16_10395 [Anaerolineales bacterium]|nr:hypothetical protein [Anaerolineales bacterium]
MGSLSNILSCVKTSALNQRLHLTPLRCASRTAETQIVERYHAGTATDIDKLRTEQFVSLIIRLVGSSKAEIWIGASPP